MSLRRLAMKKRNAGGAPPPGQVSYVGGGVAHDFGGSPVLTRAVTAGSALIVVAASWAMDHTAGGAMSDNRGGTWALDVNQVGSSRHLSIFHALNHPGGSTTITFAPGGAVDLASIVVAEFANVKASAAFDQGASNNGSPASATHDPGTTAATAQANELIVLGDMHQGATIATPTATGFTIPPELVSTDPSDGWPIFLGYKRVTSTGAQTATISWVNALYAAIIAAFKEV